MADVPEYITDPIEVDETTTQNDAYEFLQSRWPNWVPNDSNLETWMIPVGSRLTAYVAEIASQAPPEIMKYMGQLVGVLPIPATTAFVQSTWTFVDNPVSRTVEAGTQVALLDGDGNPMAFEVDSDVTVAAPALTTAAGAVTLRAVEAGLSGNGLGGVGVEADQLDPIVWVDTVTLTEASHDGTDEEEVADYLNRLSARLTLLTGRPILPRDHELLARDIARQNGVEIRALGLDGYNPADTTFGNERYMTVAVVLLETGGVVPAPIKTAIQDELDAQREVNFVENVIDPTFNDVDVTFTITPSPGADGATAVADAIANVTDFLSPSRSGLPTGSTVGWDPATQLFRQDISAVINNTDGVDHWDALTIGVNAGALGTGETFALNGPAALTRPSDILGSLT